MGLALGKLWWWHYVGWFVWRWGWPMLVLWLESGAWVGVCGGWVGLQWMCWSEGYGCRVLLKFYLQQVWRGAERAMGSRRYVMRWGQWESLHVWVVGWVLVVDVAAVAGCGWVWGVWWDAVWRISSKAEWGCLQELCKVSHSVWKCMVMSCEWRWSLRLKAKGREARNSLRTKVWRTVW